MTTKPVKRREEHILIVSDDKGRREIRLQENIYSMGRGSHCKILLQSHFVSRHHATLIKKVAEDYDYYQIIDGDSEGKNSVNGLLVNGKKVKFHDLKHGDKVVFGPQVEAVYEYREYDLFPTIPPDDPYDITLIDPAMIEEEEEFN